MVASRRTTAAISPTTSVRYFRAPAAEVFGDLVWVLRADHQQVHRRKPVSEPLDGPGQQIFQGHVEKPIAVALLQQPHTVIGALEDSCAKGWKVIVFNIEEFESTVGVRHERRYTVTGGSR